jgi:hypothetical protein
VVDDQALGEEEESLGLELNPGPVDVTRIVERVQAIYADAHCATGLEVHEWQLEAGEVLDIYTGILYSLGDLRAELIRRRSVRGANELDS